MSLRAKLMLTFISIILVVALVMGISQARLLEAYFRKAVTQQLSVQAGRLENLIKALNVMPSAVRGSGNVASWAAEASASRILITDDKGTVVVDTEGTRSLVGSTITAGALRETLSTGELKTFAIPQAGVDYAGVAVPWWTGGKITGSIIMVRPVRAAARQAAREVLGVAIRAALVAATVAAIIAYFLSSTIVDPLKKMSVAAHRIARGELNQHVSLNSRDELGDLARSINAMSAEISNLVGNLTAEKEKLQALMKERQNMISDISHDLRTPVTSIKGFVEALRDGVVTDETEKARTLDIIHDESERLTRLVNDLFYLARLESGEAGMDMDDLDLLRVVQDSVTKMIPSAREKSVTLDLAIEAGDSGKKPDRIPVKGSADRLTQAILNLLDNAVKYSPAGGLVKVTVSANASNALVSVLDQGPGISREDLPHVFDRLYRADKSRSKGKPGAGLGLSIAKVIVEKHKGSIWVESIVGQGSKFTISLPIARA